MKHVDKMPEPKKRKPLYRRAAEVHAEESKVSQEKIDLGASEVLAMHGPECIHEFGPIRTTPKGYQLKTCKHCGLTAALVPDITKEAEQRSDPTPPKTIVPLPPTASAVDAAKTSSESSSSSPSPTVKPVVTSPMKPGLSTGLAAKIAQGAAKSAVHAIPHIQVKALAGTGKTTTLIGGINRVYGIETKLVPSPQQQAAWDAMALSPRPRSSCLAAFNVDIVEVLKERIPRVQGCAAKTMHGLGAYAVNRAFKITGDPSEYRTDEILGELLAKNIREVRKENPTLVKAVKDLVGLVKVNLAGADQPSLDHLIRNYDVELPNNVEQVYDLVPRVLDRAKDVARDGYIDFNDMLWLPIVLDLPIFQNDLFLGDEVQDWNRAQQAFAKRAGRRLVLCGDPNQSIYGFAGADSDSMPRLLRELEAARGCVELPLTVTRRCGKAIVEEAKRYVPEFEAHESNPDGKVEEALYPMQQRVGPGGKREWYEIPYEKTYMPLVREGDMILCRANAPLVNQCFCFLKRGQRAFVQGRKIGESLLVLMEKLEPTSLADLIVKVTDWQMAEVAKEMAQRNPSENKVQALNDRAECLLAFAKGASTLSDIQSKINSVFSDATNGPGIKLSSIHKSKGLEARRVFYIQGFGRPMEMIKTEWERQQERNLAYVAITRAIEELYYVY